MFKKLFSASVVSMAAVLVMGSFNSALATSNEYHPSFPQCPNPGGTQIAGYELGWHQIPGGDLMEGSDYVYRLENGKYVQCFCPPENQSNDRGIQSNWLHESNLTPEQYQSLVDQDWMVIENGTQWGLPSGTYLVKNHGFDCRGDECIPDKDKDLTKHKKYKPRGKALGHDKNKFEYVYEHQMMVMQSNEANIHNQVNVEANTGRNEIKNSTRGDNHIETGPIVQIIDIRNMANMNIAQIASRHPALEAILAR